MPRNGWGVGMDAIAGIAAAAPEFIGEILLEAGHRADVVDQLESALLAANCGLYVHSGRLVEISWQPIAVADGEKDLSLRIVPITDLGLVERLSRAAVFKRWLKTEEKWVTCDAPKEVAQTYLDRTKKRLPLLFGVVTAPTIRFDGTVLQKPGYDEKTHIFFEPNGVEFSTVPERPTKAQAQEALAKLKSIIRDYEFESVGRSVALSAIITAAVRSALPAAPGHAFDAPGAGSGKTKLADVAAIIVTGHRSAAIGVTSGRNASEELTKQISSSLLAGDQHIVLDNLETVLNLPLLCQILTEEKVKIRVFGKLENVIAACVASVTATGNNLAIEGDNMRRWLVGRIKIDVERPELREFDFDPVEEAKKRRPELVVAALTVVRAYLASEREILPPLGSFEKWSWWVREALVWLGEADPVTAMDEIRAADPAAARRLALMEAWPFTGEVGVGAIVARAKEKVIRKEKNAKGDESVIEELANPDLHTAVMGAAGKNGEISNERLGWWLKQNKGLVVNVEGHGRCRFALMGKTRTGPMWRLEHLDEGPPPF